MESSLLTRRNFLKMSAGLAALAGCRGSRLTQIVDANSKTKIVYFPDNHYPEYVAVAINYLRQFMSENRVDSIALEGLVGEIDEGYFEKIKVAHVHRKHSYDYCWRAIREVGKIEYDRDYNNLARIGLMHVDPILPCCQVDTTMIRAPGLAYAVEFYGKVPLFGMEDYEIYEKSSRAVSLYHEMLLSNDCQNPKENPKGVKMIAERFSLNDYARSKDELNKSLKDLPGDIDSKFGRFLYETILDKRSVVAVENILKRQLEGTVLLIMGRAHGEGIRKECEQRGVSMQLLEELTI